MSQDLNQSDYIVTLMPDQTFSVWHEGLNEPYRTVLKPRVQLSSLAIPLATSAWRVQASQDSERKTNERRCVMTKDERKELKGILLKIVKLLDSDDLTAPIEMIGQLKRIEKLTEERKIK